MCLHVMPSRGRQRGVDRSIHGSALTDGGKWSLFQAVLESGDSCAVARQAGRLARAPSGGRERACPKTSLTQITGSFVQVSERSLLSYPHKMKGAFPRVAGSTIAKLRRLTTTPRQSETRPRAPGV
ncbi:hypothetical protein NDU88_000716 [Pleurodeles waltl]|uniref:Uncharacterized protein n=1 Tax=Pleurodeles waltl TaxID=8319 RepID=A0AAV7L9H8_PLEWA|nr:hypothetical protein NDU88_000716 [Pleurodeles waltl]